MTQHTTWLSHPSLYKRRELSLSHRQTSNRRQARISRQEQTTGPLPAISRNIHEVSDSTMKLLAIVLVVLAVLDLGLTFNIGNRRGGSGLRSFIRGTFGGNRQSAVPRVSVQQNADRLDKFLMKTFRSQAVARRTSGTFGVVSKVGNAGPVQEMYDVILVLDSSGSVGSGEFLKAKQFMTDIVSLLPATISRDNTRIACISFSDANKIRTEFNFLTHTNKNSIIQAINRISYQNGGSTHTTQALQRAKSLFETAGRRGAQKALFVATDGRSNGGGNPAIPANQMKNSDVTDVKIVVVAVSHNVNRREVEAIASSPPADHVYYVNTFTEATHVTSVVRNKMMSRGFQTVRSK